MFEDQSHQYKRMAKAIEYLTDHASSHPSLESLARAIHQSEFHVQKTFSEWVGLSPKQFLQRLHRQQAKSLLRDNSVSDTALELGYSSESRLFDTFLRYESMSPADYKKKGEGLELGYGSTQSPFGPCGIAWTDRGICKLSFMETLAVDPFLNELESEWPRARYRLDGHQAACYIENIFSNETGGVPKLRLLIKGTDFQVKVWEALMRIPEGMTVNYQGVANLMGAPGSVRAVASAVAKNPIGYLIPCHRVIRSSGAIHQYRWGAARKASMLLAEMGGA